MEADLGLRAGLEMGGSLVVAERGAGAGDAAPEEDTITGADLRLAAACGCFRASGPAAPAAPSGPPVSLAANMSAALC